MTNQMKPLSAFFTACLRGISQIMLQENALTGFLFLTGIFYDSVLTGCAMMVSVITATVTAKLLKYEESAINSGLYGFSAALVGSALIFYFQSSALLWIALLAGSFSATLLQHFFIKRNLPGFTFPFILIVWILLYCFRLWDLLPPATWPLLMEDPINELATTAHGFGEVIFQGSIVAGLLFFIAVFINSPLAALYGAAGSVLSATVAIYFKEPIGDVSLGLFSFNAVLCAIAFSGPRVVDGLWVLSAVVLSVVIEVVVIKYQLVPLTFPFVLASWFILALKKFQVQFCEFVDCQRGLHQSCRSKEGE